MKTKIVIIVVLAVLLIIFVLQNTEMVVVKFWFWDASIPEALLLFVTFAVGLIIGLMVPTSQKRREQIGQNEQTEE
ncbi:MAG: LapA family protein [Bacteroidia bacterium]|nr:MAG: LapA family protein [Bacteroidia bacterium]